MILEVLPERTGGAAQNMAADFMLLQRYPREAAARYRHYGWRSPAFTFGYSQKLSFVRDQLPPGETFDVCRRPTGGGVVDHRDDWTYALVIPRGHPQEEARATQSYRAIHEALAGALKTAGVPVALKSASRGAGAGRQNPVDRRACASKGRGNLRRRPRRDRRQDRGRRAKRNKRGIVFLGSIWKRAAGGPVDWDRFGADFSGRLATVLEAQAEPTPWPDFSDGEMEALVEQYSSPEWMEFR